MGTGYIFSILLLFLETVKGVNLNKASLDIGETSAYIPPMDSPSYEGCNHIKEAIKVLQLDTIESLRKEISDLNANNELKEDENRLLEKKERNSLSLIEKMKTDQQEEIKHIKQIYEDKIEAMKSVYLEKETVLNNTLSSKDTLVEYVLGVLRNSDEMMKSWQNTIKTQSEELNECNKMMEECLKYDNMLVQSQETIRTQSESITSLEQVIVINKNLARSYQNIAKQQQDLAKNNCDVAPWISTLSEALSSQKTKIDTLTVYLEDKDELEEHLSSMKSQVVNITMSMDNKKIMKSYQTMLEIQSKSLAMLRMTLTEKECMPFPPIDTGLEVTRMRFECKDKTKTTYDIKCSEGQCNTEVWPTCDITDEESRELGEVNENVAWKHVDCEEVHIPYLNQSIWCGSDGTKIGMLKKTVGNGVFNQELAAIPCNDCNQELFQWSSWSRIGNMMRRTRGSNSIVDSYEEEKKSEFCDSGWSKFKQSCYKLLDNNGEHYTERDVCNKECIRAGGMLTSIHSTEENNFLANMLRQDDIMYTWIGGDEVGKKNFVWMDGTQWDYENWRQGDPDGNQGCLWLGWEKSDPSKIIDAPCSGRTCDCICKLYL